MARSKRPSSSASSLPASYSNTSSQSISLSCSTSTKWPTHSGIKEAGFTTKNKSLGGLNGAQKFFCYVAGKKPSARRGKQSIRKEIHVYQGYDMNGNLDHWTEIDLYWQRRTHFHRKAGSSVPGNIASPPCPAQFPPSHVTFTQPVHPISVFPFSSWSGPPGVPKPTQMPGFDQQPPPLPTAHFLDRPDLGPQAPHFQASAASLNTDDEKDDDFDEYDDLSYSQSDDEGVTYQGQPEPGPQSYFPQQPRAQPVPYLSR